MTQSRTVNFGAGACGYYSFTECNPDTTTLDRELICSKQNDFFSSSSFFSSSNIPICSFNGNTFHENSPLSEKQILSNLSLIVFLTPNQNIPLNSSYTLKKSNRPSLYIDLAFDELSKVNLEKSSIILSNAAVFPWGLPNSASKPGMEITFHDGKLYLDPQYNLLIDLFTGKRDMTSQILPFLPAELKQQGKIVSHISPNQIIDWIILEMKREAASSHSPSPLLTTLANNVAGIWGDLYFQPIDIERKEITILFGKNPPQTPFQITFETDGIKNLHSFTTTGNLNLQKFSIPGKIDLENSQAAVRIDVSSTGRSSATIDQTNINIRSLNDPLSSSQTVGMTNGKITDGKSTRLQGIEFLPGVHVEGSGLDLLDISLNLNLDITLEIPFLGKARIQAPILLKTELKKISTDSSYQIVPDRTLLAIPDWTIQWGTKVNPQKMKGSFSLSDLSDKNSCSPEDPSVESEQKPDSIEMELDIDEVKSDLPLFKTGSFHFSHIPPTTADHYYDFSQLLKFPHLTATAVIQQKDGSKIDGIFSLDFSQNGTGNKKELKISLEEKRADGVSQNLIKNGVVQFSSQPDPTKKTEVFHLACQADSFLGIEKPELQLQYQEFPEEDGWRKFSPDLFKLVGNQNGKKMANQWLQGAFGLALKPAQHRQTFIRYNGNLNRLEVRNIDTSFSFEKIFPPPLLAASQQRYKGFDVAGLLIADGIFDLKNLRWNGTLALRGSKAGDLFLRDSRGNLFEARLDPAHPERLYPLPLARDTLLETSQIDRHTGYWSEGDFLFKSEVDLKTVLPEADIDLTGIIEFAFTKLPHSIPEGFDRLFSAFLENLSVERKGKAFAIPALFDTGLIASEEAKLKVPSSYTQNWLQTVPDLLKLIQAGKARLRGLVINGGFGGPDHCRYSQLVEKEKVKEAECYLEFDPQTTATLEFEIKQIGNTNDSQITQFRLMYDPKKPVQYHGAKVGNAFILYNPVGLLNCTGPVCPGFEEDLGSAKSLADIRTPTEKNEEGLSFRFITPFTAPSWDLSALNFTEAYLKGYGLEDLACFIRGTDLKHRIPLAVLKKDPRYSLKDKSIDCRIPATISEAVGLFRQGITDYKKLSVIDPNDCEDLNRCPDPDVEAGIKPPAKPSLIDFLSSSVENGVQIETYLRNGPLRMPIGILDFTTESADREKAAIRARIGKLKTDKKEDLQWQLDEWWKTRVKYDPKFELNRLRERLQNLETNSARLSLRADDKQITVTFKNPELNLADFSNENHQLQLKGLRAKEMRVTLPYSLPKLRELIREKKFHPSDIQVEIVEATATEIHFSNPKTKAKLHLKTANRADPIKLDLFSWKPNADGMEIHTSNPKNRKSGIHLPKSLSQFEISPGEIFSSEFENASMQEGLLRFDARFDREFNLSKLTYSVESENFTASIKKGHARSITLDGSTIQGGSLKITQDSGDPTTFPTLTARGYGVIKANPIRVNDENFNIPGLRIFGLIDAEVKGNFLLRSTATSLILESDPDGGSPIHMENGKVENLLIDQDLGKTKPAEELKDFPHKDLIHTRMRLGAKRLQIGKLEKVEILLRPQNGENPIRSLIAGGIELGEIEGGGEFWFAAPAYKFLRGFFPKIGPQPDPNFFYFPFLETVKPFLEVFTRRKSENYSSFFRLGRVEIVPEKQPTSPGEKEAGTYLSNIDTQLFEVGGEHQYFKFKYPDEMKVTPKGKSILSGKTRRITLDTVLKDKARGGKKVKFETIQRDLRGLRYRVDSTDKPAPGKVRWERHR